MHRADLQNVLVKHSNSRIHLSHRLVSFDEGDEIYLHFENGTIATCDFLVGMDGIKSVVRRFLLLNRGLVNSPSLYPVCSGYMTYRALIPAEALRKTFPGHRALTNQMLVSAVSGTEKSQLT